MIQTYHRPTTIEEALKLLARNTPKTVPLGGGTILSHSRGEPLEVVDLQSLGLDGIARRGRNLVLGATATLQRLIEYPDMPAALVSALRLEVPLNLRNMATVGGTLVACDGRSAFVATLLALDASLRLLQPEAAKLALGEFLPLRGHLPAGSLIIEITVPFEVRIEMEKVSRMPADHPIVGVAIAQWPSGRMRVAVCGHGPMPLLAMDGTQHDDVRAAVQNALNSATDSWGSQEYRKDVAAVLANRCLDHLRSSP